MQVKKLSADINLIVEAIKGIVVIIIIIILHCVCIDSGTLKLDTTETKVKAIPEKRCILILREIPKDTPKEV